MAVFSWKKSDKYRVFTWVLSKYNYTVFETNSTGSDEFSIAGQRFKLEFLRGRSFDSSNSAYSDGWRLFLCYRNKNSSLMCKYRISIIMDGEIIDTGAGYCTFSTNCSETLIFNMFRKEINKLYSCKDYVHVCCELLLPLEGQKNFVNYEFAKMNEVPKLNFEWIFLDESLSDVKLRTAGGKKIPAHRVVLAAASPVFKAMFSHDMLENKSQSVDMIDVSFETAVEVLRYIYTGSIENNEVTLPIELLAAAEKYQLELLKNACEKILSSKLSTENSLEMLKISDTYSANHLKKEAVDFIKSHINELSDVHEITNMILGKAQSISK